MEKSSSPGMSWADQWDCDDPAPYLEKDSSSSSKKRKSGMEKTKVMAASTGLKKLKDGAAHGIQWLKGKYQKRTQKP